MKPYHNNDPVGVMSDFRMIHVTRISTERGYMSRSEFDPHNVPVYQGCARAKGELFIRVPSGQKAVINRIYFKEVTE